MINPNRIFPQIILASASPRRSDLLQRIGLQFCVCVSHTKEPELNDHSIEKGVQELAQLKAANVAKHYQTGLIIGADTTVVFEGRSLGKPKDHPEATSVLQKLSGSQHEVLTGVILIDLDRNRRVIWCEKTTVYFRQLDLAEIEDYVASGQADDKAGSYGIQGQAAAFVDRIEGCYFNVVGLPLASLVRQMRQVAHSAEGEA